MGAVSERQRQDDGVAAGVDGAAGAIGLAADAGAAVLGGAIERSWRADHQLRKQSRDQRDRGNAVAADSTAGVFRNHSGEFPDGWGNASAQLKYRIASGNAEGGNFAVTAMLGEGFGARAYQNGALSGYLLPKVAAGKAFGRFDVIDAEWSAAQWQDRSAGAGD